MSTGKNIMHNLYESVEENKFSGVEFEKNFDHEMRFKEYGTHSTDYDIPEGTLYWVTQEPFTKEQLINFGKALNKSRFDTAYVTVRDLSTYDYERDLARNVLAKVDKDGNIDFDGYWNEAKVFFDDEELTESILNELDSEVSRTEDEALKELAESIKNILTQCNADISYITPSYDELDNERRINMSCKFTADKLSKYDNDVSLYGNLYFDESYKLVKSDIMTSSGPNILNYDFIKALNALYSYFKSGNNHYDL